MPLFRHELLLRTALTPQQVHQALERATKPGGLLAFDVPGRHGDGREFRGQVNDRAFRVIRRVQYRNSFTPVIEGQVSEHEHGSELRLSLSVHPLAQMFLIGWTTIAAVVVFMVFQRMLLGAEGVAAPYYLAMLPFSAALVAWLAFKAEVPRIEGYFRAHLPPPV